MKIISVKDWQGIPCDFTGIAKLPKLIEWYKEGKRHREDGPAVEDSNGTKSWFKEGRYHREDGPAIEFSEGSKFWYINGNRHRLDGPAKIWANGHKEWWVEGKEFKQINLKDYVVLDYYKGDYDLMWYKILGKNKIFEYPDIPGLITK